MGDFRNRNHAAADQCHFAAELVGQMQNLLQPMNRRTEAGDEQTVLGAVENIFETRADGAFGIRIARPVGVGRIGEQQQHAALAVVGEGVEIEELVVGGRRVDFEIAGVDDDAEGRSNRQCHALTIECVT